MPSSDGTLLSRSRPPSRTERIAAHIVGLFALAVVAGLIGLLATLGWLFRWFGLFA